MNEEPMPAETAYQLVHDELQVSRHCLWIVPVLTFAIYVPLLGRRLNEHEPGDIRHHVHGTARGKADDGDNGKEHH